MGAGTNRHSRRETDLHPKERAPGRSNEMRSQGGRHSGATMPPSQATALAPGRQPADIKLRRRASVQRHGCWRGRQGVDMGRPRSDEMIRSGPLLPLDNALLILIKLGRTSRRMADADPQVRAFEGHGRLQKPKLAERKHSPQTCAFPGVVDESENPSLPTKTRSPWACTLSGVVDDSRGLG